MQQKIVDLVLEHVEKTKDEPRYIARSFAEPDRFCYGANGKPCVAFQYDPNVQSDDWQTDIMAGRQPHHHEKCCEVMTTYDFPPQVLIQY